MSKLNSKPIITTDLDGVQCQFNPYFHEWVNKKTLKNLEYSNQTSFAYEDCWGETKEYWRNLMIQFCKEGNLVDLPIYEGGVKAVKELSNKYQIIAVTFRHPLNRDATLEWVGREIPEISDVIFEQDKAGFCKKVKAVAHIDDSLDCVRTFTDKTKAYLIDRPWNQSNKEPQYQRADSWDPILSEFIYGF